MPSNTLLIEIGTEELPPKSLNNLRKSFEQGMSAGLTAAGLTFSRIDSFATPRRLAVQVHDLIDQQPDQSVERRGPATAAAFDSAGEPTKALLGFMKGCGVSNPSELATVTTDKGDYLVYQAVKPGLPLSALLEGIVSAALAGLPVEKRMRWGKSRVEFVRPVQWLVSLYGKNLMPLQIMDQVAGNQSLGHRFMSKRPFRISHANEYVESCRKHFVLADFDERRELIRQQVMSLAGNEKSPLVIDEDLLQEVTSLVEWPVALAGGFDPAYLKVPPEVLISAMKKHQRYFHLLDARQNLLPRFITVSNIESSDSAQVVAGNERVIRPRLSDAAFFFEQDTRTTLEAKTNRLGYVVFQADLGTYLEKANRIAALSGYIAGQLSLDPRTAERAGLLCKADLVSDMVGEFPDLQGIMGSYYARHDGESPEVCEAIAEHYRPTQSGGILPTSGIGACVALADKLDSLVGLFGINQPPTGSRDPFALRRQALGVIRICIENQFSLALEDCLSFAADSFGKAYSTDAVSAYIIERLSSYYADQGIGADAVEAATSATGASINLLLVDDTVRTLQAFRNGPTAERIVAANKRVANLLKKANQAQLPRAFDATFATEDSEIALHKVLLSLDLRSCKSAGEKLEKLAVLQAPVDRFFDEVMVMVDDEKIRDNRLCLLRELRNQFLQVADFSLLQ